MPRSTTRFDVVLKIDPKFHLEFAKLQAITMRAFRREVRRLIAKHFTHQPTAKKKPKKAVRRA